MQEKNSYNHFSLRTNSTDTIKLELISPCTGGKAGKHWMDQYTGARLTYRRATDSLQLYKERQIPAKSEQRIQDGRIISTAVLYHNTHSLRIM